MKAGAQPSRAGMREVLTATLMGIAHPLEARRTFFTQSGIRHMSVERLAAVVARSSAGQLVILRVFMFVVLYLRVSSAILRRNSMCVWFIRCGR